MSDIKIYLELDEEAQQALADNQLTIKKILHDEWIEADVTYGTLPYQTEDGARTKELVTIILASSVLVSAIAFAVSRIISEINNKPHYIEYYENMELKDRNGDILRDADGKPIFKKELKAKIIQPRESETKDRLEANFDLTNGIVIKYSSETSR